MNLSQDVARPLGAEPVELYRSARTVVARIRHGPAASVVTKSFLGPDALTRMRHEARVLERLRGLPGIVQLLRAEADARLVLRDDGGAALEGHGTLAPETVLDIARRLARALAGIHRRGVLHLDISPANILLGPGGAPLLIDFHLATLAAEERRGFTHHNEIAGTLAYMAPELTGRIGQGIDHRADLYALGATLYELATGTPPFGHGDPLRLMRDLIATLPVPPIARAPALAPLLSDIMMRLLEKEPDHRYQSAEGLADDLDRLGGENTVFALGATDFPLRLLAPSRLIAREAEVAALAGALADAQAERCRAVLVSGAAGVGKTALIDQLRPIVTAQGGWFVYSKFAPGEHAGAADPMLEVIRGAAALMLAEPEAELTAFRAELHARLGADAGLLSRLIPELAALLGPASPLEAGAEVRTDRAVKELLGAMASPARPLVIVHDDLHWASALALQRIGTTLALTGRPGLLIVCAYRDREAGPGLRAAVARWQELPTPPRRLQLENLSAPALSELVGETLRLPPEAARPLAAAIGERSAGNPSDTLDMLNGLRRENTLFRTSTGWQWDGQEIRRHVGDTEMSGILQARIAALPAQTQSLLADLACLGSTVALAELAGASAAAAEDFETLLSPALEDGLLVLEQSGLARAAQLRFRNQRVHEAIQENIAALDAGMRLARRLDLARRLAARPGHEFAAAEQYLAALAGIETAEERARAASLFGQAAAVATREFRHDAAERFHAGALTLQEALPAPDRRALMRLRTERMAALYHLGRHEEADLLFAAMGAPGNDPLALADATCIEVLSLGNRGRHREAMAIGLSMLDRLGVRQGAGPLEEAVRRGLDALPAWVEAQAMIPDAQRRQTDDPLVRAAARLIMRLLPPAQLHDPLMGAWLTLESQALWARHGVCPEMVANLARGAAAPNVFGGDYRTGYAMARLAVATGAALGFETETALARQNYATFAVHWFERLEHAAPQTELASAALMKAGEVQAACINYIASLGALFDCAPTLEVFGAELADARGFIARTGNAHLFESFHNHLLLMRVMNGTVDAAEALAEAPDAALEAKPLGLFSFHASHAVIAALLGDAPRLAHYSALVMPILPRIGGAYRCAVAAMMRALSLAWQARLSGGRLPAEFGELRDWFAGRAADAPANFKHILHFLDAEGAWARGEGPVAAHAFDRALQYCQGQSRPWHHALIAERAGLFQLAMGLEYGGRALLHEARDRFAAWGAPAVVRRLTTAHGFLDAAPASGVAAPVRQTGNITAEAMDMLGILRASQALSSATTIGALQARVVETLAAMTGATAVLLVLWDAQRGLWCLPPAGEAPGEPAEAAAARGALPLSALRYVERTRETLVVDDARLDDRFARDPYFADLARCALLVLPVDAQGSARAMLLLENRLTRGVFSQTRLNLVTLIAGQLAVSLDNAQLYASLEQRVAERTEALAEANRRLEGLSIQDGLTGLANRRRFDEMLAREWRRAERSGSSIGLVMVDIDHFKRYNDHYGHLRGDYCLRAVAEALAASTRREIDITARYGGEEFVVILPGADLRLARGVAERGRAAVAGLEEPHEDSPFGIVTASLGVAALVPEPGMGPERLIELADAALYRAKREGRNGMAVAE